MAPVEPSAWEGPATSRGGGAGRPARYEIPGHPGPAPAVRRGRRPAEWRGLNLSHDCERAGRHEGARTANRSLGDPGPSSPLLPPCQGAPQWPGPGPLASTSSTGTHNKLSGLAGPCPLSSRPVCTEAEARTARIHSDWPLSPTLIRSGYGDACQRRAGLPHNNALRVSRNSASRHLAARGSRAF
jgi:hypothetical protein